MRSQGLFNIQLAVKANMMLIAFAVVILSALQAKGDQCAIEQPAVIERQKFGPGGGQGYRMTYCVALPLAIYWRFKTDFDNDFLTSNPHITAHQFIRREGDVVLTENRYAHNVKRLFRWQTVVDHRAHRLDFNLQNPDDAGQEFHFGTIQLVDQGPYTVVHQAARFKFSGDALWAFYPWRGGMRSFLQSFVAWEKHTALEWHLRDGTYWSPAPSVQAPGREIFSRNWRHPDK